MASGCAAPLHSVTPAIPGGSRRCHNGAMADFTEYIASLEEPARTVVAGWRARALELVPGADWDECEIPRRMPDMIGS